MLKVASIIAIFLGEAIAIYAEVFSSKVMDKEFLWGLFTKSLLLMLVGCVLLLFGYIIGVRSFHNIWVVSVISITSILVAEPAFNYLIFQQLPTPGAFIGLILGIVGLGAALFY